MKYNKYVKMGDIHWQWYLGDNWGYQSLVNDSLKHFSEEGTIIDIGCGDGLHSYLLANRGFMVTGIDPEKAGLEIATERSKYFTSKGLTTNTLDLFTGYETTIEKFVKENNQSFDYLYSLNTIEHVDDPNAFVEMMKRIKKFGIVITDNKDKRYKKSPNHIQEFTRDSLKDLFKDFKIEDIEFSYPWTQRHFIGIKIQ